MNNGYISLHRKLLENPISKKANWAWLWVYLLLRANWVEIPIIWNGKKVVLKRGSFMTGRSKLAEETGIPESTIERALNYLERENQIEQQKNTKYRVITIVNWETYQKADNTFYHDDGSDESESNNKRTDKIKATSHQKTLDISLPDSKRTANGQLADTDNNINNINKTHHVVEIIDAFKEINPSYKKWFAIPTQRKAAERMLEIHGKEKVLKVISILPQSNTIPYIPSITSPYQLEQKWADLEIALTKLKNKSLAARPNVIM